PTDEPGQGRGLLRSRQAVRAPGVATARGGARRRPHPRRARQRVRFRPPLLAGRRAIAPARRRLDLRPRDDRPGVPARRARPDGLAGRPLREGDRVAYTYFYPCGRCYACLANEPAACPAKIERPRGPSEFPHFHGAFAEYYYLRPRGALFLVPDALPDEMVAPV